MFGGFDVCLKIVTIEMFSGILYSKNQYNNGHSDRKCILSLEYYEYYLF